jgi:hypothetical protein
LLNYTINRPMYCCQSAKRTKGCASKHRASNKAKKRSQSSVQIQRRNRRKTKTTELHSKPDYSVRNHHRDADGVEHRCPIPIPWRSRSLARSGGTVGCSYHISSAKPYLISKEWSSTLEKWMVGMLLEKRTVGILLEFHYSQSLELTSSKCDVGVDSSNRRLLKGG